MTPHPQRCETCKHKLPDCDKEALGSRVCKKIFLEDPKALQIGIPYFIDIVGCASHSSATELEESEQWRRVYENGYTDGQQAEREQVIQQFIDFEMSGKCVKTDKAVSCDAICERDCFVCFAESLRGGATQQGGERR